MIDDATREDAALYALDMLQGAELHAFEARLQGNAALAALVEELRSCSVELVNALPAKDPPAHLRANLLAAARAESAAAPPPFTMVQGTPPAKPRLWPVLLPWSIAACFSLLWGISFRAYLSEADRRSNEVVALNREVSELMDARDQLRNSLATATQENDLMRLRVATLTSQEDRNNLASVVWDNKRGEGVLHVQKLPANPAETVYQLWVVGDEPLPIDGGTFTVGANGDTSYHFHPKKAVEEPKAFAISLEKGQGVPVREGPIVLSNL